MKIVASVLFLFLTAGLVFSAWTMQRLERQVQDLESRIATLGDGASAHGTAPTAAPAPVETRPGADKAAEVPKDAAAGTIFDSPTPDAAVRKSTGAAPASAGSPPAAALGNPEAWTEAEREAFERAVTAVLEKKQKERDEKQDAQKADWILARMKEQLKLTDQQAEQIAQVLTATRNTVKDLRATVTPENKDEIRPQIQAAVQAADQQVKALLTAEQATAYDEMKKQGGLGMGGGGGGRGGGGRRRDGGNQQGQPE